MSIKLFMKTALLYFNIYNVCKYKLIKLKKQQFIDLKSINGPKIR